MSFTANLHCTTEVLEKDGFGTGGITKNYFTNTVKMTGADRYHEQVHILSASLSAHSIAIAPFGGSVVSETLVILQTDKKIDVRIGSSTDTFLSAVQFLAIVTTVSGLFITTGSQTTTVRTVLIGGSNVGVTIHPPMP